MSPLIAGIYLTYRRFPRTRGDEPGGYSQPHRLDVFSPHARG